MSLQENKFILANGLSIPAVAYGAGTKWFKWGSNEIDEALVASLKRAFKSGFVHVDGAEIYGTDAEIGVAIKDLDRSSIFLQNKFSVGDSIHQGVSPHGLPYNALKHQLDTKLKTPYVDLYLLHSPFVEKEVHGFDLIEAWRSMEKLVDDGLTKSIGVSNFSVEDLKKIFDIARIKPVVNQIEFSACLQDQTPEIVEFSQKNDVLVVAYSSLGPINKGQKGELKFYLENLAETYHKTPEQILLRWVLQRGILPVTTSSNEVRIEQFADIFGFELSEKEVNKITSIGKESSVLRQWWVAEYTKYDN